MPPRPVSAAFGLGLLLGAGLAAGAAWLVWGRPATALAERVASLESSASQVQAERDRLHGELNELVRERREMADTAERLRAQVEQQLRRLESLAQELAPPAAESEGAPGGTSP
jgi:hypothetical protein